MKSTIFILGFIVVLNLSASSQGIYQYSDEYSAVCNDTKKAAPFHTSVYVQNDSIIIEDILYNQCCPEFALTISELEKDTLYVTFTDTTKMMCDCMCYFDIKINAGRVSPNVSKVNYNGLWYNILPALINPIIEVGKKWNSLSLIPGLENILPTQLEYTIESNEAQAFCWNGKFYFEVKTKYTSYADNTNPSDTVSKYIREENGKVYLLDQSNMDADGCEEYLIYDFTLNIGDTVILGYDSIKYVVVPTEISEVQGRRCMALADLSEPQMSEYTIWIEGIGDVRGLFKSTESLYMVGVMNVLTCCSINDKFIYQNPEYTNCGIRPQYQFFIEEGKTWTTVTNCFFELEPSYTSEITISNSNMEYNLFAMRFYPDTNFKDNYYLEENGRVYYNQEDKGFLIYDFTLNPGDSVKVGNPDEQELFFYVDSLKYMKYMDDNLRKTLYLSGDHYTTWVEGIGDLFSPLEYWQPIPPNGCIPDFACCSLMGELLYQNLQYPNCGNISSISPNKHNHIRIFPNPANEWIEIQGLEDTEQMYYSIVNSIGKIEQEGKLESVIALNLSTGIYILILRDGKENIKTEKFIVE